jgi:hypothetical protein
MLLVLFALAIFEIGPSIFAWARLDLIVLFMLLPTAVEMGSHHTFFPDLPGTTILPILAFCVVGMTGTCLPAHLLAEMESHNFFLSRLTSNCNSSDLSLPNSSDYLHESTAHSQSVDFFLCKRFFGNSSYFSL